MHHPCCCPSGFKPGQELKEEEPYFEKMLLLLLFCTPCTLPVPSLLFKEFRPPMFLRIGIFDTD
jgi:hypothetical protein